MNIELRLLATMLYTGDFSPLLTGTITRDHFTTEEGKRLHTFITTWRDKTGVSAYPSLSIVRTRFRKAAIDLPDPDPADNVAALAHETVVEKFRVTVKEIANELEIAASSADPMADVLPEIAKLRRATESTQQSKHMSLGKDIMSIATDYVEGTIHPSGIPWPWETMNKYTRGIHRKEMIMLLGRPKSRKTFMAIAVGVHAMKQGERVLMFTPEMPPRQVLLRVIATLTGIRYTEFKDGTLDPAEEARLFEAADAYGLVETEDEEGYFFRLNEKFGLPPGSRPAFDIVQSTGRDLPWIESQVLMYNPSLVIGDSLYRQSVEGMRKNDSDVKAMTSLSRGFKDLVMNHNVAGLITHQLNRGAEEEVGTLSNISFGDAFGQDLDLGLRVVTGKVDGIDRSALVVMGGREVPFDGILVNNVPCCDYNEVGPITNMKIVERLMKREQEEDEEEEGGGKTDYAAKNRAKSKTRSNALSNAGKQARSAFKGVTYDGGAKGEEEDVAEAS